MSDIALLARFGFRDPERALQELPPDWRSDSSYYEALGRTPDPDGALRRAKRLDALGKNDLIPLVGFGEYLTDLLAKPSRSYRDEQILKIAARDLATATTRESLVRVTAGLSTLADECVRRSLDDERIAVIAMGKYGAQELNYASDIDVLFVGPDEATPRAKRLMQTMNGPPVVFRVDADLRPEGRDGPLVRSLDAYRAYYERWAQVWEFQALIKSRFAVGNDEQGKAFEQLIQPFVWPETLKPEAVEQVRVLKARAEEEVARRGLQSREVKLGTGGIRDIEFALQLLQLVHGRHHPELRERSTLGALDVLSAQGFIGEEDASDLIEAYVFLRHVEHRLQLESGRQTHTLPDNDAKRELIGRAMGFNDLKSFETAFARTTSVTRSIHERLFYRPLLEAFAAAPALKPALSTDEAVERLLALGYDRAPRVRDAIVAMTSGSSRRAKLMRAILPGILAWMAETPEPDAGMMRLADVTKHLDAVPQVLTMLRDEPPVAELLCRVLGTGPVFSELMEREPSTIAALGERAPDQHPRVLALSMVRRAMSIPEAVRRLRRFKDAEFVRIASRDLASGGDFLTTSSQLSDVGDACIDAALLVAWNETTAQMREEPTDSFAVIGMGRFGGRELSFASDLDVVFVYGHEPNERARQFHSDVSERIMAILGSTPPIFRVDTELRPEGRSGAIVRSLDAFKEYYEKRASLWEFQALTRARHVAGDPHLTASLLDAVSPRVYRETLSSTDVDEIRRMKARIERERVKQREDPRFQVKLGVGGLADVEFTVQLLQMMHGHAHPDVRTPNTYEAIERLENADLVEPRDADWLREAYLLLNRVRNHMFLLRGLVTDAIPSRDDDVERLARSLGFGRQSRSRFLERYMRVTRRARRVTDRLFYGEE